MNNEQHIKTYICEKLAPDIDPATLPTDIDLLSSGVIDSLSLVRLVVWIEEEYGILMGDIDIAPGDFSTVEMISTFIKRHKTPDVTRTRYLHDNTELLLQPY